MLRPNFCVTCEKVLIEQDGVVSLVRLFTKFTVVVPPNLQIEKNAANPKEWVVFSSWETEEGDERREYFLCTQVLYPDNSLFGEPNKTRMNIVAGKRMQMTIQLFAFPIGQLGIYTVKTWIEENNAIVCAPIDTKIELEIKR